MPPLRSLARLLPLVLAAAVLATASASAAAEEYVWMEGEAAKANVPGNVAGWGNADYLSKGQWLHYSIQAGDVAKTVPEGGIVLAYPFSVQAAGEYAVWNRVGFEYVRSPFDWRIDAGPWHRIEPTDLTTDLMELSRWCEVAWLPMGKADLKAGDHRLEVRLPVTYKDDAKTQPNRILFASDAVCLAPGAFRPNGKHKPDADWRTDRDREAARHVFEMPAPAAGGERTEVSLAGVWQIARWDEAGLVRDRTGPAEALPKAEALHWSSIPVPGDRNALRPDLIFCHRYVYRTRVKVPAEMKGRSFFLRFTETSMLATVFVNGRRVAFHDAPLTGFLADATEAVRPGEVNEIAVVIKDAYYAIEPDEKKPNVHRWFNIPLDMMSSNQGVTMRFDYPMKGHLRNGITDAVRLVATGPAYAEDVFVRPSVARKDLAADVTVRNPGGAAREMEVACEVVPASGGKGGKVAHALPKTTVTVPAGGTKTVTLSAGWDDPHLWWPDDPHLYWLVTTVTVDGKRVDVARTRFGFREWTIEGTRFVLNGVPWQMRANLDYYGCGKGEAEKAVAWWRESGQNVVRLRFQKTWGGMTQNEALDFFDSRGVPVRRTCSTLDGQHASYGLVRQVEKDGKKVKVPNTALFTNWRKQIAARVRQQRNHPCVFVWELDNEIIYINTRNFGNLDTVEPEFTKAAEMIRQLDPTGRGVMVAGGRALQDQSLPVNGCHYEAAADRTYPDMAYGLGAWTDQTRKQPWPMAKEKPIFLSEEFFAHGRKPAEFAGVGGERCFLGRAETSEAVGLLARMYSEGYRWQELGAFHFWFGRDTTGHYASWQPVLALCRQWNWTFAGGSRVPRTLMVRNDTRLPDPIELEWTLAVAGKRVAGERQALAVPPGHGKVVEITLPIPKARERTAGTFALTCRRGGETVWTRAQALAIIDPDAAPKPDARAGDLVAWDPDGAAVSRLKARGVPFTSVDGPDDLPDAFRCLLIGKDALTPRLATDARWHALAAEGKRLLVLDQAHPLHYQAVPADFEVTDYEGRVAFPENLEHPVFAGLAQEDFFCWSGDHVVYRNVYKKASRGARSLAQCDDQLSCSAVAECTVGDGLMLLSQMVVCEKLESDPVAQRLFDNLVDYALGYELVRNTTAVVIDPADPRARMLETSGLEYKAVADPLAAVRDAKNDIVVADASPAALKALAGAADDVAAFTARGGWLMLWNVGPKGLADFNRLVGCDHLLRGFRCEKVALAPTSDPLASGLSQRDVALSSGKRVFGWKGDEFAADDVFTHVVDLENIAPFMTGPGIEGTSADRPDSIVNGFTGTEAWKYIKYYPMNDDGSPQTPTWTLPRKETLTGFSIVPNDHYWLITKLKLVFDGDESTAQTIALAPQEKGSNMRQDFTLEPVTAKTVTFVPLEWKEASERPILGIDNLWLRVERPEGWRERVRPLLNIGGLVKYPRGKGGILLNQLNVKESEAVPVNAAKKQTVVATLLRNLHAVFAGRRTLLPGEGLRYHPVSLEGRCNLYLTSAEGWPDKEHDLSHLPLGEQKFAGVTYRIRDFKTSPLESAVTLGGLRGVKAPREVTGLEVGRKADVLFFLHTFVQKREWQPRRTTDAPPVIFQYVVHYADGKTQAVDVQYGQGAAHWLTPSPGGLRDAAVAWAAPLPKDEAREAVLYQFQWNNPRPEVAVKAVDLRYHEKVGNRWGTPVLLGLTAAEALE